MLKSDIDTEGNRTGYRVCCARSFRVHSFVLRNCQEIIQRREKSRLEILDRCMYFLGSLYPRIIFLILR